MKVVCLVGMPGSGKNEVLNVFEKHGIPTFNMGDIITKIEPEARGITEINEYVESEIREDIRKKLGPAAVAIRTVEEVRKLGSDTVAIAGIHSFEELEYFKKELGEDFTLVAVECNRDIRRIRLSVRAERAMSADEFEHREKNYSEIFDVAKLIEQADISLDNNGTKEELVAQAEKLISEIKK
ncbi:MAG: AAA family ATPase [Candidatus Aenigmarchaeota archaeon]